VYDEAAISAEFRALAAQADQEFGELRQTAERAGRPEADDSLARSCVFGYLYDRYFLESPEMLLNELRWLKQTGRPHAPRHALSIERFQKVRDELLDELILRFDGAAD